MITGQFRNTRDSMNAYVVFKEGTSVMEAVKEMNGFELEGKHLRVDRVGHGAKVSSFSVFFFNVCFPEYQSATLHFCWQSQLWYAWGWEITLIEKRPFFFHLFNWEWYSI